MRFLSLDLRALACLLLLAACDCGGEEATPCVSASDCLAGWLCLDSVCVREITEDGGQDMSQDDMAMMCPSARRCGDDLCCDPGLTCGGGACCSASELCGGVCCGGSSECVADRCIPKCEEGQTACGDLEALLCCGGEDVCYFGACTTPGATCVDVRDCAEGEYCESSIGRCLPRQESETVCEYRPHVEEFEMNEEWSWTGDAEVFPTHYQVMMAPMVANLTDDNGDGLIDENDIPDVLFSTFTGSNYHTDGVLRVVSGADGSRIWPTADPGYRTHPGVELAIADVNFDSPGPEVIAARSGGGYLILSAAGELLQQGSQGVTAPSVADMDHDGVPEILLNGHVIHADGTVVMTFPAVAYSTMANMDEDDQLEVVTSQGVYKIDPENPGGPGIVVWDGGQAGRVSIADLDLDGKPETISVIGGDVHSVVVRDGATGTEIWRADLNAPGTVPEGANPNGGGSPTIANFDDDPYPEIALAGGYSYVIFEHDGTLKWYDITQDRSSRATGSSVFDFEGDGVAEVLYNDELYFRVYRGPDGTRMLERCNTSGTLAEYPIVVDVDNDNHAEIVLMENNYAFNHCDGVPSSRGIHVFGHPEGQWVRTRRIWNQHTYHVTNINEDGTVPLYEEANWLHPGLNNFRQNVQPDGLFNAPDLVLIDLHAAPTCPTSEVSVRVVNQGSASAPAGIPVSFYTADGEATPAFFGQALTTRVLLPGESEVLRVSLSGVTADVIHRVAAVLNDPERDPVPDLNECLSDNNSTEAEFLCRGIE